MVLEEFFKDLINLPVNKISLLESEKVDFGYKKLFIATTAKIKPKYSLLELAIIN